MMYNSIEDVVTSLVDFVNKRKATIRKNEILKIAYLVRIKLSDEEVDRYSRELTVLDWIHSTLLQVNIDGVLPMCYGSVDMDANFNDDVVRVGDIKKEILSNTKSEYGYFVVPRVFKKL